MWHKYVSYTFPLTNLNKVSYNFVYKYTILVWTLIHLWTSPKKGKSLGCPGLIKQRRIRNICLTGFPCPWWWRRRRHEEIWRAACPATSQWGEASSRTAPGSPGSPLSLQRPLPCFKFWKWDIVVNISEIPEMCEEQRYSDSVHGTLPKIHISYFIHHIFLSISICPREPIHRCTFLTLHFSSPQCQVCGRLWQIDRQLFDIFCFPDRAVLFKTGPKKEEVSVHLVTLFVPRQVAEPSWRGRFSGIWHWKAALVVVTWSRDRWQDWQGASKVELPRCHGDRFPSSGEHQCWPNHLDVWLLLCKLGGEGRRILRTCSKPRHRLEKWKELRLKWQAAC